MKKKFLIIIMFLFGFFFLNNRVFALESSIKLNCDKTTLNTLEKTNCNISVSVTSGGLLAFDGKISLTDNLELTKSEFSNVWQGSAENGNFSLTTTEAKDGNVSIGSIEVKVKDNVYDVTEQITLSNIVLKDENSTNQNSNDISQEIKVSKKLSDNANLESLNVSVGTLSPSFDPNVTDYTIDNIDSDTINITATAGDNASITGTGLKTLNYGNNTYQVVVKAEAGNTKTYNITIKRVDNRSDDNSLKSLKVNNQTIELSSDKKRYEIDLPSTADKLSVLAEKNHSKASIKYSNNDVSLSLNETYTVYIYVTAENGVPATYSVTAKRVDNRSSNNNLKSLKVNDKSITLNSNQSYTTTVDNSVTTAKVVANAQHEKATVKVTGSNNLKVGNNVFTIVVTAENEAIKTYKLTVIRKNSDGDVTNLSNNTDLKNLTVDKIDLDFKKDKLEYSFEVENNITKLKINYEVDDSKATAVVEGNDNLKVGLNTIKILVTAENGESATYLLKVTRKDKNYDVENNTNSIINALGNKEDYDEVIVTVKTTDSLLIPNNIIKKVISSNKKLTYKVMEDTILRYSIVLNGHLFDTYEKDINYSLSFDSTNSALLQKIGSNKNIILNFKHNDVVPTGTTYNIYVGDKFVDGTKLYLYKYNMDSDSLDIVNENLAVEDGYVDITLDSLIEYVLLDSKLTDNTDVVEPEPTIPVKKENDKLPLYIIAGCLFLALVIIIIVIIVSKSKKKKKDNPVKNDVTNEPVKMELEPSFQVSGQPLINEQVKSIAPVTNNQNVQIPEITNININSPVNNSFDDIDLIDLDSEVSTTNEYLLGISAMDVDDYLEKCPLADLKNSDVKEGVVIVGFENNSKIQAAGLHQGDVLISMNNQQIMNKEQFRTLITGIHSGQEVSFTYYRNGIKSDIKLLL